MGDNSEQLRRHVHGRRLGRPLSPARQNALDGLMPRLGIPSDAVSQSADLDPMSLFKNKSNEIWLEIGFGSGEHLRHVLTSEPHANFIGAEPYVNGMSAFLKDINNDESVDHDRVRVHMDDAIELVDSFTDKSIDGIYILNPDPWHKKRHHKRRIVRPETLDKYARILKKDGTLIMTSDVDALSQWMCMHANMHPDFEWTAKKRDDWLTPPEGWLTTRYESKGREAGRTQSYLIFKRK